MIQRKGLARRIDSLQEQVYRRYPDLDPRTQRQRFDEARSRVLGSLGRERMTELVEMFERVDRGEEVGPLLRVLNSVMRAVYWVAWLGVKAGAPLVLPPELADIYAADPDARPTDVCKVCRYPSPASPTRRYFTTCPLCGGELLPSALKVRPAEGRRRRPLSGS
jgi:hypothetical protein